MVVADGLTGIENVVQKAFPQASIQLCTVQLLRGAMSKVEPTDKAAVTADMKVVLHPDKEQDSPAGKLARFHLFIDKWMQRYSSFKNYKSNRYALYLNYLAYKKK